MKLFLFFFFLFNISVIRAEVEEDNDFVVASLLLAQPGDVLYSCAGHAFLRMECPSRNLDFCFSYEGEPVRNQIVKFMTGKLKMGMFAVETADFLKHYEMTGRGIKSYRLNLPLEAKKRMWQRLDAMYSEGISLPYDYVKRGCAISCKNIVEGSLLPNHVISYESWSESFAKTRGEILIDHVGDCYPWNKFFLYTLAGVEAWEEVSNDEKLIIPEDLACAWQNATVNGEPIIKDAPCELVPWNNHEAEVPLITPLLLSLLFLSVCIVASVCGWGWMTYVALILQSAIGLVLAYLFFISDLPNTSWTWLIIPFNPLPLLLSKYIRQWAPYYSLILITWIVGMVVYPVRMTDQSYYVLCLSLIIILNITFIQKTVNFMKKNLMQRAFMLFACVLLAIQSVRAGDDDSYYWFHNRLSAYPTGKGVVYGTTDFGVSSSDLTSDDWKESMTCKYYRHGDPDGEFYAFAKPAPGYQTVGWYRANNGVPGEFLVKNAYRSLEGLFQGYPLFLEELEDEIDSLMVTFNPFMSIQWSFVPPRLEYTISEDDLFGYYNDNPDNDLMAVFGKVGIDIQNDKYDYQVEDDSEILHAKWLRLIMSWQGLQPYISKPANDVGDRIELGVIPSFSKELFDTDQVDDLDNPIVVHINFTYWSNDKGEKFYTPVINVDVKELDTYVCHVDVTFTSAKEDEEDDIEKVSVECLPDKNVYSLHGALVNKKGIDGFKPGVYIIGDKKILIR